MEQSQPNKLNDSIIGSILSLINQFSAIDCSNALGKIGPTLVVFADRDTYWIIDSGAINHMTYSQSLFQFMTISPKESVVTTNGDVFSITKAGSISPTTSLSLHNMLFIPALANHLLSVSQVTRQLDRVVLMFPSLRLLQDVQTQAVIGRGYYEERVVLCGSCGIGTCQSSP